MFRPSQQGAANRWIIPKRSERSSSWGATSGKHRRQDSMARRVSSGGRRSSAAASSEGNSRVRNDTRTAGGTLVEAGASTGGGAGGRAVDLCPSFAPVPFRRFQNPETPFIPQSIKFPPPVSISLPSVWSWQLTESRWVPFDPQISTLLETLWGELQQPNEEVEARESVANAGERVSREARVERQHSSAIHEPPQQQQQLNSYHEVSVDPPSPLASSPVSHKVYVHLAPWRYCIDLEKMYQQNMMTQRVRLIQRSTAPAALWFVKGEDGCAHRSADSQRLRFDQVIENLLEDVRQEYISRAGVYHVPSPVAAWQQAGSSELHFTDIVALRDSIGGRGDTFREVVRVEITITRPTSRSTVTGSHALMPPLPSLTVGNEESGEARCSGTVASLLPEDCRDVLLPVDANTIPEDSCAICLDSLHQAESRPFCSDSPEQQQRDSAASKKVQFDERGASSDGGNTRVSPLGAGCNSYDSNNGTSSVVRLKECPHFFHVECMRMYIVSSCKGGLYCPTCNVLQLPGIGPSPPGRMKWKITNRPMLSGHPTEGTIIINYDMEGGIQTERHAQPNTPFSGTRREAYLPDCLKARQLLRLLIQAFVKGHLFTVGQSVTSGRSNVVIWNGIHHKTSVSGGVLQYGYPDDTFLSRLAEELKARGFCFDYESAP